MIKIIIGEVDWWSFGATIFSGIIAAIATIVAVVYSNYKSNEHFKEQEEKYRLERKQQFQESKFVVLKPTQI